MANSNSMVSEQDRLVFYLASKSLNFCLFSSWFFSFFHCFRTIMAVYITHEELDKILFSKIEPIENLLNFNGMLLEKN